MNNQYQLALFKEKIEWDGEIIENMNGTGGLVLWVEAHPPTLKEGRSINTDEYVGILLQYVTHLISPNYPQEEGIEKLLTADKDWIELQPYFREDVPPMEYEEWKKKKMNDLALEQSQLMELIK